MFPTYFNKVLGEDVTEGVIKFPVSLLEPAKILKDSNALKENLGLKWMPCHLFSFPPPSFYERIFLTALVFDESSQNIWNFDIFHTFYLHIK